MIIVWFRFNILSQNKIIDVRLNTAMVMFEIKPNLISLKMVSALTAQRHVLSLIFPVKKKFCDRWFKRKIPKKKNPQKVQLLLGKKMKPDEQREES